MAGCEDEDRDAISSITLRLGFNLFHSRNVLASFEVSAESECVFADVRVFDADEDAAAVVV